jgi:hypothetical protein
MTAYIRELQSLVDAEQTKQDEASDVVSQEVRDRLTPLDARLEKLLSTIPTELQCEGLSLNTLQTSLKGRWQGTCHPGELGNAYANVISRASANGLTIKDSGLCGFHLREFTLSALTCRSLGLSHLRCGFPQAPFRAKCPNFDDYTCNNATNLIAGAPVRYGQNPHCLSLSF